MGHPQPAHLARARAHRWGPWVVLVLLILAPVVVCQVAFSSSPAEHPAPASATACQGGLAHDDLCARGLSAAAAPTTRAGRDDATSDGLGPLIAMVLLGAAAAVVPRLAVRSRPTTGPPPWASQQLIPGRHQLLAIGVSRV